MKSVAVCRGQSCSAKYTISLQFEPLDREEVTFHCDVSGIVLHQGCEINRRNISGNIRAKTAELLQGKSPTELYYDNLLNANKEKLDLGNFTAVPTQAVLRKIVSESIKKEYLHSSIISELEILKEAYSANQFIHDIGANPFTVIMYSKDQLKLIKELSKRESLDIYVDATGSVIGNIGGQKRPYLYSIVVKPREDLPPVSVADMLSTQHTVPRIEFFFATLKRAVKVEGGTMIVNKVETDFSFAMIQACLSQFGLTTLKTYLNKCGDVCLKQHRDVNMPCLHICSAYMLNNFSRSCKHIAAMKKKMFRRTVLNAFAKLQNALTLEEATSIYGDICRVFLSKHMTEEVETSMQNLNKKCYHLDIEENVDLDDEATEDDTCMSKMHSLTIKEASPFTAIFQTVKEEVTSQPIDADRPKMCSNESFCPDVPKILEDKFIPTVPLWSGMLMSLLKPVDDYVKSRDTNVPAENWFKYIKHDRKMIRMRPARFAISLQNAVEGRLMEQTYEGARRAKSKKRKRSTLDADVELQEEVWQKNKKTRAKHPKYHPREKKVKVSYPVGLPAVMKWGGEAQGHYLSNTCTIDNGLTIIHIYCSQHPQFKESIQNSPSDVDRTLASVMALMTEGEFVEGKLVWVNYVLQIEGYSTNLHGDEYDKIFHPLCQQLKSRVNSRCPHCSHPYIEGRTEHRGITVTMPGRFKSSQDIIDRWMMIDDEVQEQCKASDMDGVPCTGHRILFRTITPVQIVVLRVYEHCLYDRLSVRDMLLSKTITIGRHEFTLAGVTLHNNDHYCAVVQYEDSQYWYDGLIGRLAYLPKEADRRRWFPSHAVYCKS